MTKTVFRAQDSSRWQDVLPWLGMAAPFTLIAQLFTPVGTTSVAGTLLASPYPAFVTVCALAFALARRMDAKDGSGQALRALDVTSMVLMALACSLTTWGHAQGNASALVCAMEMGGAGVAWAYLRWGRLYARLDIRRAAGVICLSVAVAGTCKVIIAATPTPVSLAFQLALACGGLACLHACSQITPSQFPAVTPPSAAPSARDLWAFPTALVILCATLGVLYNVAHEPSGGAFSLASFALESLAALVVFWWVCLRKRSLNVPGIAAALAVVIATGTFALSMLGQQAGAAFYLCTNADHALLTLFLWIVLCDLATQLPAGPARVFAAGWVLRSAPFWLAGRLACLWGLALTPALCNLVTYLVVVTLALVLAGNSLSARRMLAGLRGRARGQACDVERGCANLARTRGLTARESEVLLLLARGHTRPHIAEALELSENTVRGYTKSLYKKLDIHDRQALFALVDASTPAPGGR